MSSPPVSANPLLPHQTTRHPVLTHFPAPLSDITVPPSHPLPSPIFNPPPLPPQIPFIFTTTSYSKSQSNKLKMGICTSIDASSASTAKLILPDGTLQQYTHPVRAHYVLQRLKNAAFCICNSDEMDFNDVVSALGDNETLHLGELYFVLPLSYLKRPLKAAEMAELAVRASAALMESCGSNAWLSDGSGNVERRRTVAEDGGRRRGRGRGRSYSNDLSAIAE